MAEKLQATLPATAAGADYDQVLGEAPQTGRVTSASYTPEAAITGDTTESRTLTVVNKGAAGSGTTTIGTLAFTTGVNGVAFDERAFTLSGTAANKAVTAGDVIAAVSTHVGSTGLADPGGQVRVEIGSSAYSEPAAGSKAQTQE